MADWLMALGPLAPLLGVALAVTLISGQQPVESARKARRRSMDWGNEPEWAQRNARSAAARVKPAELYPADMDSERW